MVERVTSKTVNFVIPGELKQSGRRILFLTRKGTTVTAAAVSGAVSGAAQAVSSIAPPATSQESVSHASTSTSIDKETSSENARPKTVVLVPTITTNIKDYDDPPASKSTKSVVVTGKAAPSVAKTPTVTATPVVKKAPQSNPRIILSQKQPFTISSSINQADAIPGENAGDDVPKPPLKQSGDHKTIVLPPVTKYNLHTTSLTYELDVDNELIVSSHSFKLNNERTRIKFSIYKPESYLKKEQAERKRKVVISMNQKMDGTDDVEDESEEPSKKQKMYDSKPSKIVRVQDDVEENNEEFVDDSGEMFDEFDEQGEFDEEMEDEDEMRELRATKSTDPTDPGNDTEKGTSTGDLELEEEPDDMDDGLHEQLEDFMQRKETLIRKPATKKTPAAKKASETEGDDSQKRIYIKTNAYAKNENYKIINLEDGSKMYECRICNWQTKHVVSIKDHVRVHLKEKPFICGVCTKAFSNQSNLNCHLARHYDNRPFECDVCSLTFKLKSSLNVHKKRHYEEKKFACEVCGKRVFSNSALKQHLLTHTETRPYPCEMCNKRFKTSAQLTRHQYIHTGGGKHECPICFEMFVRKEYWRSHMKKKHDQDVEQDRRVRTRKSNLEIPTDIQILNVGDEMHASMTEMGDTIVKEEVLEDQPQTYSIAYTEGIEGQEIHIQEGEFNVITGESGATQIAIGEEIVGVISGEEALAAVGADGTVVQGLDKDTQAQVEYLVNLQYEYVK